MSDHQPEDDDDETPDDPRSDERAEEREPSGGRRRLGDSLLSSLLGDSTAAFRRGQGLVSDVAQGTKEELVRVISAEVRGFLDKMDAADLVQEIVAGLVIEMKTEIRFTRAEDGRIEPEINTSEAKIGHEDEAASDKPKGRVERMTDRIKRRPAEDPD